MKKICLIDSGVDTILCAIKDAVTQYINESNVFASNRFKATFYDDNNVVGTTEINNIEHLRLFLTRQNVPDRLKLGTITNIRLTCISTVGDETSCFNIADFILESMKEYQYNFYFMNTVRFTSPNKHIAENKVKRLQIRINEALKPMGLTVTFSDITNYRNDD